MITCEHTQNVRTYWPLYTII